MPVDPHGDPVVTGKKDKASSKMASGLNLTAFQDVVRSVNGASFAGELQRKQAVADASALLARLESPWETASRLAWGHPTLMGCIATLTMLGFFQKWVQAGGGSKLESELAKLVPCDPVLLNRLLRHLASNYMLNIDDDGRYSMTSFTSALAGPEISCAVDVHTEINGPVFLKLPEYLKKNNFQNPTDPLHSDFDFTLGKSIFEWLSDHPRVGASVNQAMKTLTDNSGNWADVYPVKNLIATSGTNDTILVDLGGNTGYDVEKARKSLPIGTGGFVLQDRPEVIAAANALDPSITKMPHDFFTAQPVKNASAYFLHSVLHDWPDSEALKILEAIKPAMKKGHSRILIHDYVVGPKANLGATTSDITMMGMASAAERTETMWNDLLSNAGLKIVHIWNSPLAPESIIEAELE